MIIIVIGTFVVDVIVIGAVAILIRMCLGSSITIMVYAFAIAIVNAIFVYIPSSGVFCCLLLSSLF